MEQNISQKIGIESELQRFKIHTKFFLAFCVLYDAELSSK